MDKDLCVSCILLYAVVQLFFIHVEYKPVHYHCLFILICMSMEVIVIMQAMQYASPKALWNLVFGVNGPSFGPNEGDNYICLLLLEISELSHWELRHIFGDRGTFQLNCLKWDNFFLGLVDKDL